MTREWFIFGEIRIRSDSYQVYFMIPSYILVLMVDWGLGRQIIDINIDEVLENEWLFTFSVNYNFGSYSYFNSVTIIIIYA